ncbi:glycosyltransferase family 4 protein [Lewinella cohaerens]|uniref:glycosyltransferase family 4 protein n=1 Tax=Lewinella cohaerens TaxID=70995 RepID=UPI0003712376|nr:MraY family glycosyltransferase [Lewinella cohaerens]
MLLLVFSFLTAFALTYFAIPSIIHIARDKQLYDVPVERSSHYESTPSLGGIAIFSGAIFSMIYWTPLGGSDHLQYVLCAMLILLLIGAKDDISPVSANKKIISQIMAASILVIKSDTRLESLYGVMGLHGPLPEIMVIILSVFTILVITNAFNLIDGINGLAGSLAVLIFTTFGVWFFVAGFTPLAAIAFAVVGAVLAFLKYNYSPAQIFMGDTGALMLGLMSAFLAIKFIDLNDGLTASNPYRLKGGPAVAIGILLIPLFDTIRVFSTRIIRGQPPLKADRRHIHHLLIDAGKSHTEATAILVGLSMFVIALVLFFHDKLNMHLVILFELALMSVFSFYFHQKANHKRNTN